MCMANVTEYAPSMTHPTLINATLDYHDTGDVLFVQCQFVDWHDQGVIPPIYSF